MAAHAQEPKHGGPPATSQSPGMAADKPGQSLSISRPLPSDGASRLGTVAELWRYPVKSLRGERLSSLTLDRLGVSGDRRFAFESSGAPTGKPLLTGRERARLLLYTASGQADRITITTPTGQSLSLHNPQTLSFLEDLLHTGNTLRLVRSSRPLTDCRPVALLSLQTIRQLESEFGAPIDPRRFRANLLLDLVLPASQGIDLRPVLSLTSRREPSQSGTTENLTHAGPEDDLVGRKIRLGTTAVLMVTERDPRCRVVILDPETAEPDPRLMKLIDRFHSGRIGVYATVHTEGTLHSGDPVTLL